MTGSLQRLTQFSQGAIPQLRVSSALNPCLWLAGSVTLPAVGGAVYVGSGVVQIAMVLIAATPVALFAVAYLYFMVKDPNKLRSEDYELRKTALDMIQEKGGQLSPSDATSVEAIANPDPESRSGRAD